jgi:acylphosphatase
MTSRVNVIISGRVQGVWFRASTKEKADQLGITGWVRNTPDGHVEAVFEGDEKILQEMLDWCHHGPQYAKVKNVKITEQPAKNDFRDFSIKY